MKQNQWKKTKKKTEQKKEKKERKEPEQEEEPEKEGEVKEKTEEQEQKTEEKTEQKEEKLSKQKLSKQKVSKQTLYIIAAITIILVSINIYIYAVPRPERACYQDLCFYSEQEPIQHMETLLEHSNKAYLVFEGDAETTETTAMISESAAQFAVMLGPTLKHENIHGIGMRNNEPVECGNKTVEYCKTLEPGENELLLYIEYPDHDEDINEVHIDNRTITIKAKSGENLLAVTRFIDQKFVLANL